MQAMGQTTDNRTDKKGRSKRSQVISETALYGITIG
jgi:hypothetical protein